MFNVLNDLRVVEMAAFVAGPLAGMTLAQLGARVIRVDDVGGNADIGRWPIAANGRSLYWAGLNKAKQSLCVDLGDERGQALVADLICDDAPGAGILITNFPMKGWLAYEKLAARRPDLIVVQITGDWQGRTALDYTVNAGAGFPFITGDGGPTHPVNNVTPGWDLMCGSHVAIAVLAAERRRRDTGKGSHVRVALQDMGLATIGSLGYIAEVQVNDQDRQGYGNHIFGTFGNDFGTKDDRRVMIMAISVRQWRGMQKALGFAAEVTAYEAAHGCDLNDEGQRFKHREQISAWVEPKVRQHTLAEIGPLFDANGVCWGVYRSARQALAEDPNCSTANPLFQEVEQPGIGRYLAPGSPMRFADLAPQPVRPAPTLGEHGAVIAAGDLKRSVEEVAALRAAGVLADPGS